MSVETAIPLPRDVDADRARDWRPLLAAGLTLLLAAAIALRLWATSPMWLDEAQTVEIARRAPGHLFAALRHDGSPPLYYLVLHGWMQLVGTGTLAVRALSGIFAVAALPAMWFAVRRLTRSRPSAWVAVVLLATCPFAVRYATEARMYSLLILLVLLAAIAFERVWAAPRPITVAAAAFLTACLVLTHYWALFLVAVSGAGALVAALRGVRRARPVVLALALGCLAFVPWLPSFLYQTAHTGAPWGRPPDLGTALGAPRAWAGGGTGAVLLAIAYYALPVLAIAGTALPTGGILLRRPWRLAPSVAIGVALATMLLGVAVSGALGSAYAARYSAVVLAPFLLGLAGGLMVLPARSRFLVGGAVVALGLAVSLAYPHQLRTQAQQVADALAAAEPGDVVVFCPDQLGPAVHRLAPDAGRQEVFPTGRSPAMVDWVDYADRNAAADPLAFSDLVLGQAGSHAVWLVYANGYPTFGDDCGDLFEDFTAARGDPLIAVHNHGSRVLEHERVAVFLPR